MRRIFLLSFLSFSLVFPMAEPTGSPPEVKNINVIVIDKKGVKHILRSPTCEGLSYIKVKKGDVEYAVSLTNVKKMEIINVSGDKAIVKIHLKNGKAEVFELPSNYFCSAVSDIGNASFTIKDVKEILFRKEEK